MPRRLVVPRRDGAGGLRALVAPLFVGLCFWISSPTTAAYQDMASFVSGSETSVQRWAAFVETSVAGSVHNAEMRFLDPTATGAIAGAGLVAPGVGTVAFKGKAGANEIPDEARINRGEKRGRIVNVVPVAPPKSFNAGSVFERTSSLLETEAEPELRMAFVISEIQGKEVQIAGAFHVKEDPAQDPGVPAFLASLVNNEKADVLATAYAPAEPDYARASPFASILREDNPSHGRFIPPVEAGDHAWMSQPLPAHVFDASEQKCLANGIYFEARGESLRGQAAVAQVILNRVRNPAYPDTICGVVYQNDHWHNRCQFSFACDGKKDRITSPSHYKVAQEIALAVTAGKIFIPEVASSTHYYAQYVSPRWARSMEKMKQIGLHIFYRTYGGGWN